MGRVRFSLDVRFLLDAQVFRIDQILLGQRFMLENLSFGGKTEASLDELCAAWGRGALRFETHGIYAHQRPSEIIPTSYTIVDFQSLPEHQRDAAWYRYTLLLPILRMPPSEQTRERIEAYIHDLAQEDSSFKPISARTVQRWLLRFIESNYDLRALVPATHRRGAPGQQRLKTEVDDVIKAVIAGYEKQPKRKRSVNDVYYDILNRIADINKFRSPDDKVAAPSLATVYRRVPDHVLQRPRSRLESQQEENVRGQARPTRPYERVEYDMTPLDLFVIDEDDALPIGRPLLCVGLDVASAAPPALYVSFEAEGYLPIMHCLLNTILPKPDPRILYDTVHTWPSYMLGLPEEVVFDGGPGNCRDLEEACGPLGIPVTSMPRGKAWYKGAIERFIRSNNQGLIHGLPGSSLSNIYMLGDYDPTRDACITKSLFIKLIHIFWLDMYMQDWHDGIEGIPAKRWEQGIQSGFVPTMYESAEEVRILLGRTDMRTVQREGIQYKNIFYQSSDLIPLRNYHKNLTDDQQKVKIKIDPEDLSTIYVRDVTTDPWRWLKIPADDPEGYTQGLSLWKHNIIRAFLQDQEKKTVDIFGLAAAKAKVQRLYEDAYRRTKKLRTRSKAKRYLDSAPTAGSGNSVPADLPSIVPTPVLPVSTTPSPSIALRPSEDLDSTGWDAYYLDGQGGL